MSAFIIRSIFAIILGIFVMHGIHSSYLRWRDQGFDWEEEYQVTRELLLSGHSWVRDMLRNQGVELQVPVPDEKERQPAPTGKSKGVDKGPMGPIPATPAHRASETAVRHHSKSIEEQHRASQFRSTMETLTAIREGLSEDADR